MNYFREAVQKMKGYLPGEQPTQQHFIKLNTNENPYPPSPRVLESVRNALTSELMVRYPPPLCDELRKKASQVYGVPQEWIMVGNGSDELLNLLFRAVLNPRDRVAYPIPTYSLYRTLAQIQEAEPEEIPYPDDFSLPDALVQSVSRLKIICNPNSPTGTVVSQESLLRLLETSTGPVLIDEAYADFALDNALSLVFRYPHLLVARTFSKSFSLAGLRIGLLFGQSELISGIMKIKDSYNVNRLSQIAAEAALDDMASMQQNIEAVRKTRDRFTESMKQRGYSVYPSQANFILVRQAGTSQKFLYEGLKKRNILIRFFESMPDCLRISIGTNQEMNQLLESIDELTGGA